MGLLIANRLRSNAIVREACFPPNRKAKQDGVCSSSPALPLLWSRAVAENCLTCMNIHLLFMISFLRCNFSALVLKVMCFNRKRCFFAVFSPGWAHPSVSSARVICACGKLTEAIFLPCHVMGRKSLANRFHKHVRNRFLWDKRGGSRPLPRLSSRPRLRCSGGTGGPQSRMPGQRPL